MSDAMKITPPASPPRQAGFSRSSVSTYGSHLRSGIYEFIPLPFADDFLIRRERRKLVENVLIRNGVSFEPGVPEMLAGGGRKTFLARLGGLVRGLILKPLRKLLRTVLFWFTVRRAVLTTVESYLLARFASHPGLAVNGTLSLARAKAAVPVFERLVRNIDQQLAGKGVRRIWGWLREAKRDAKVRGEELGQVVEDQAPGILSDFDQKVGEELAALGEARG